MISANYLTFGAIFVLQIILNLKFVSAYTFERIDKTDAALLIVDHQVGLYHLVRDFSPAEMRNNLYAHAAIAKIFNLPVVMTTSAQTGPNGPLPKEILDMHPNATLVKRNGEVNAWDNSDFRTAVEATGKKQLIIGGIATDVCTTFLALSLREAGYTVFANADASGTFDLRTAQDANARMRDAGVYVVSQFAVATDLMRDWRNTPGTPELLSYFHEYLPAYGFVIKAHGGAVVDGALLPTEDTLIPS